MESTMGALEIFFCHLPFPATSVLIVVILLSYSQEVFYGGILIYPYAFFGFCLQVALTLPSPTHLNVSLRANQHAFWVNTPKIYTQSTLALVMPLGCFQSAAWFRFGFRVHRKFYVRFFVETLHTKFYIVTYFVAISPLDTPPDWNIGGGARRCLVSA